MPESKMKRIEEHRIRVKEAAQKLRALADDLEKGTISINGEDLSIALDSLVNISLKSKGDKLSTKLRFRTIQRQKETAEEPRKKEKLPVVPVNYNKRQISVVTSEAGESEPYKDLKKRMSQDFKVITRTFVKEKTIPESPLVERFCRDSKAMCEYPDLGEEYYKDYLDQLEVFYQAFKSSDVDALGSAITALNQIKKDCHARYK